MAGTAWGRDMKTPASLPLRSGPLLAEQTRLMHLGQLLADMESDSGSAEMVDSSSTLAD